MVARGEGLSAYDIDPASIDPATSLLIGEDGPYVLGDPAQYGRSTPPPVKVQHVALPPYGSAPHALVTEAELARHGWTAMRAGWIAEAPHALTASQIAAARAAAAKVGLAVEVRDARDDSGRVRTGATLIGGLVALAIVATAVGLIRGESARDIRTLTATGAAPHPRRALTATTAAALALVGA